MKQSEKWVPAGHQTDAITEILYEEYLRQWASYVALWLMVADHVSGHVSGHWMQ